MKISVEDSTNLQSQEQEIEKDGEMHNQGDLSTKVKNSCTTDSLIKPIQVVEESTPYIC